MDTSPLAAFCFSGNQNSCMTSISGYNEIDKSNFMVSGKKYSDKNNKFGMINLKQSSKSGNNSICFDTGSFKMSPTTSLVAELSGNFYIDKSPVPPTPRRSLLFKFSCDHQSTPALNFLKDPITPKFDSLTMGNINIATPCSSPIETMDYSPLPQKHTITAFSTEYCEAFDDQNLCSYVNPEIRDYCDIKNSKAPLNDISSSNELNNNILNSLFMVNEKSKINPSILDTNYDKENADNDQIKNDNESCDIALNDLFSNSPNPVRFSTGNVDSEFLQPFKKPLFSRYSIALEASPLSFMDNDDMDHRLVKWRRTQSLYKNSCDFLSTKYKGQENSDLCLQLSPFEFNSNDCQILPCFSIKDDRLKRIDSDIIVRLLDGHYHDQCDEYMIVDCRFEYEYNGGHIMGAININTKDALDALLLDNPKTKRCLIIFHCEYSSHRAPRLALYLRNRDRQLNMKRYPLLYYPEIYILHGGYRSFYEKYKERCEPQNYVEMDDSLHKTACAREMCNFRRNTKFLRTLTYTYGQTDAICTNTLQKDME
ncbi:hypothetical protein PNEG_02362 [Pneumocystis murina B123]|uniref:M-phase inducer phosphatase n=1 Tax=Pneumocystis murina (strain B123) TaxID=1069680 RepID=M7NL76_PNEMU|nr:hypothetical protein PNEG_02362 [Pneumocystis murina B123]EMR09418.1 hypothetical protein PNEG_02362 [Pneumocystis murina B123]